MDFNLFNCLVLLCAQLISVSASRSWIVAGQFDPSNVSPLCGLNCIKPIGPNPIPFLNRSVGLHRCVFSPFVSDLALWTYNSTSYAITVSKWDARSRQETATFCLDNQNVTSCSVEIPLDPVSDYPTKLNYCTGAKSQQWRLQKDGRIQSGLLSAKGEVLYLQSQTLRTEPGGHAPLCLGPANNGNSERHLYFTIVPYPTNGTLYSALLAAIPSPGDGENLISNGGFEDTAPRSTSAAPAGNFTLFAGNPDLCYWSVGNHLPNSDQLGSVVVTSPWSNPGWNAQQGNNSLLMGGNSLTTESTVTQLIRTRPATEYTLSFYLAGYPTPCQNKTLRVQLSPSSNTSDFMADAPFNPSAATNVVWKQVSLNFIARTKVTNLTFLNPMKAGVCAAVIDNVAVVKVKKPRNARVVAIAIPVAVTLTVVGVVGFFVLRRRWRRRELRMRPVRPVISSRREREKGKEVDKSKDNNVGQAAHIRTYAMWEILEATDNFNTKVGEGGFGAVYRADLGSNRIGAVKRATKRGMRNPQMFKEELSVLLRLNHPNLVNLIGLCFEQDEQILVFEFVPNGSVHDRLHKVDGQNSPPLSWASRMNIALQMAVALQYLHEQAEPPVLHHDVKSSNVLLVDDNTAKLADFGLSKLGLQDYEVSPAPIKGSFGYTDPEYIKTGKPSMKSDVYSFGVLLLELITGLKAVHDARTLAQWSEQYRFSPDIQVVASIVDSTLEGHIDLKDLNVVISIVNRCLQEKGEYRPSMGEIMRALVYKAPFAPLPVRDGDRCQSLNRYGDGQILNRIYDRTPHNSYVADNDSASILYDGR